MTRHGQVDVFSNWFHGGAPGPPLAFYSNDVGDVDAYALLDQGVEGGLCQTNDMMQHQLQMQMLQAAAGTCSNAAALTGLSDPLLGSSPGNSPRQAGQRRRDTKQGSGSSNKTGRKCTSLAQREAHKRYRERKKQSIAAMEVAVQAKRQELEALQAENQQLRSRARVLETAERCSVEIHELMKLLDGLQSMSREEPEVTGANRAASTTTTISTCDTRDASDPDPTAAAAAAAGSGSSPTASKVGAQQHASQLTAAAAAAGSVEGGAGGGGSFLQNPMMDPNQQQQQVMVDAGRPPPAEACASTAAVQPLQLQQQQAEAEGSAAARFSLQSQDHWLQMAQRYLDTPEPSMPAPPPQQQQHGAKAVPVPAPAAGPAAAAAGVVGPARTASAAADGAAAAAAGSLSGLSVSSTAESGSSVLTELGSVDTPEQGLVVYRGFLQRASEMLATAQHQQQQGDLEAATATEHQLGELTRSTIGRLQPFLVARGQGVVYDWNARNLASQQPEEPPPRLWPAVLDALQLSAEAQADALHCFELFGAPLTRLLEERVTLARHYRELQAAPAADAAAAAGSGVAAGGGVAMFAGSMGAGAGGSGAGSSGGGGGSSGSSGGGGGVINVTAARTLESVAGPLVSSGLLLNALAANLERYQALDGVFAHSLTSLLTGAQIAAACVASYPYLPRWHAMMSALKQQREEEGRRQSEALQQERHALGQSQRRSSRVRTATLAAREAYA